MRNNNSYVLFGSGDRVEGINIYSNSYSGTCCNSFHKLNYGNTRGTAANPMMYAADLAVNTANAPVNAVEALAVPDVRMNPAASQRVNSISSLPRVNTNSLFRSVDAVSAEDELMGSDVRMNAAASQRMNSNSSLPRVNTNSLFRSVDAVSAEDEPMGSDVRMNAATSRRGASNTAWPWFYNAGRFRGNARENEEVRKDVANERINRELAAENRRHHECDEEESSSLRPEITFNSATGSAGPLPVITTLLAQPINVVSVNIDARRLRDPAALLFFTSQISLPLGVSVTLNFQITRSKDGGTPVNVGSTYTFSSLVDILESEAFSFQFFDAPLRPGLYTYSVQLSTNSIIDVTPGVTVNNATLSVLAVSRE